MEHEAYMREALRLAREAAAEGEVPVGCVVVKDSGHFMMVERPDETLEALKACV